MKVELSHDILAKSIYDKASQDDKRLLKISAFITERHLYYKESKTLLVKKDLEFIAPYISKIVLSVAENEFLDKSKKKVKRRRNRIIVWLLIINIILAGFIIYIQFSNATLEDKKKEIDEHTAKIKEEEEGKLLAEKRADSLMQARLTTTPTRTSKLNAAKLIISSYDTLKQVNQNVKTERNIAQSATLSSLAEEALQKKTYTDTAYAFKLAAKSWQLNKENKQACQVLYSVSGNSAYDSNSKKKEYLPIKEIIAIERNRGRGDLKEEEMNAIFNKDNAGVSNKKAVENTLKDRK